MRLLNTETGRLEQVIHEKSERYAILSHTWEDREPTFQDFLENPGPILASTKIRGLRERALREVRPYKYVWIDTICIDKTSSAELQEAINSMYKWYQSAGICYAYLEDVADGKADIYAEDSAFRKSRWFTRGWTLQELLAPRTVVFVDRAWKMIAEKQPADSLAESHWKSSSSATYKEEEEAGRKFLACLATITGIPEAALSSKAPMNSFCVAQKMCWAGRRQTTRDEDRAYCLLGLFGVNMPMLYGEGHQSFVRLQDEIMKRSSDHSVLAYNYGGVLPVFKSTSFQNVLRPLTPLDYLGCRNVQRMMVPLSRLGAEPGGRPGSGMYQSMTPGRGAAGSPGPAQTAFQGSASGITLTTSLAPGTPTGGGQALAAPWASGLLEHYQMTNKGLHIQLDVLEVPEMPGVLVGRLDCIVREDAVRTPEDRVVVVPLLQLPSESNPHSRLVLRTPGASLVDLPLWLFHDAQRMTKRQLYITSEMAEAGFYDISGKGQEWTSRLEIHSFRHPFVVSEMYPPVLTFTHFRKDFRNTQGWPMHFVFLGRPPTIYMRLGSENLEVDFFIKMELAYDYWQEPAAAKCSVAVMPPSRRSLLELLMLDEYPAPAAPEGTVACSFEYVDIDEYKATMSFDQGIVVQVTASLLRGNCIRIKLEGSESTVQGRDRLGGLEDEA